MIIGRKVDPASWGGQYVFRDSGFPDFSKLGIRDLKVNSELKVCAEGGIPKITLGITGL